MLISVCLACVLLAVWWRRRKPRYLLGAGALIGRMVWGGKPPEPVDPVQVMLTQVRTHAVIEHERQVAIWYRACPQVLGKTPQLFIAWPAKLVYELELGDVQIRKEGSVIKVSTSAIHSDDPSVPTDFVDYLATTSIFTFGKKSTTYSAPL